jgi:hypothetical protein
MGTAQKRRQDANLVPAIPNDIGLVFDELDIERTWDYLEKFFRLNKKWWKQDFEEHYIRSTRELTKMEIFYRYGKANFQPAFNVILARAEDYPTWAKLIRYIVRDKIREKQKELEANRNYYTQK